MEVNIYYHLVKCSITCIPISLLVMEVCGDIHRPWDSCLFFFNIAYRLAVHWRQRREAWRLDLRRRQFFMHSFCQSWFGLNIKRMEYQNQRRVDEGTRKGVIPEGVMSLARTMSRGGGSISSLQSKGAGFFDRCQELFIQHGVGRIRWKVQSVEACVCPE